MTTPPARAFRALLLAVREKFAGDAEALRTCRLEARRHFRANAGVTDAAKAATLVADAFDAARFLRESVVQARLTPAGRYAMTIPPQPGVNTVVQGGAEVKSGADRSGGGEGGGGGGGGGGSGGGSGGCGGGCDCG
jgi:uncharacterized membrane protein YgcG